MGTEFKDAVAFHQHLCLDIAIGYRAAKTLVKEMGDEIKNMKEVVALVGNETCALDAIQEITGCTFGKRNLILAHTGKAVYILQNTSTGNAVRVYCKYWDTFDHSQLRELRKATKRSDASDEDKEKLKKKTEEIIDTIMAAPDSELFSISRVTLPPPPKSGKYLAEACDQCGEHVNVALLTNEDEKRMCQECATSKVT